MGNGEGATHTEDYMSTCLQNFSLQKCNHLTGVCYIIRTCTAILCLNSEVEGNSTNVLSCWHCNVDTKYHLSICFPNCVYAPLKSHHHSCKKNSIKLNGIIIYISVSQNLDTAKVSAHLQGLWYHLICLW